MIDDKDTLDAMIENFLQSVVDEQIKANAEFSHNAGLTSIVIRTTDGNCCDWCNRYAKVYIYPDVPEEAYKRHQRCGCTVTFKNEKGQYKDVHSKKELNKNEVKERIDKINNKSNNIISINQHKDGNKVFISNQAIEKVRMIHPKDYSEDNIIFTQQIRKKLLKYAQKQNNSNEVACIIYLEKNTTTNFIKGTNDTVDILKDSDVFHWLRTCEARSLELVHNHPGLSYFSLLDINVFMSYDSIGTMSIVTNQGKTWYIRKTDNFDIDKAIELMKELMKEYDDNNEIVEKFLKKCYKYGVERN